MKKAWSHYCSRCKKLSDKGDSLLPHMPIYFCAKCIGSNEDEIVRENEIENRSFPKWRLEQVKSLEAYQRSKTFYPSVCEKEHILKATAEGLVCDKCDYIVGWTYDWTLDWSWKLLEPPEDVGSRSKLPPNKPIDLLL